ncbi:hypothetical protein ACOSQ4_024518 [Xanthoceras sorbifolium]
MIKIPNPIQIRRYPLRLVCLSLSAESALWFLSTVAPSLAIAAASLASRHRLSSPLSAVCSLVGELSKGALQF